MCAIERIGVPYGSRTRVAAVKETRFTVILCNFAAWIALRRTLRTHGNAYWTFNGRVVEVRFADRNWLTRSPAARLHGELNLLIREAPGPSVNQCTRCDVCPTTLL